MKNKFKVQRVLFTGIILLLFSNCKEIIYNPNLPDVLMNDRAYAYVYGTKATWSGVVTSDGSSAVTARGICWGTSPLPTVAGSRTIDGTGVGSFSSNISGLSPKTTYYLRPYAINSLGTRYGYGISVITGSMDNFSVPIFNSTLTYGTVTDIDGNVYKTIQIGTQTWMAENLKVTRYNNGDSISNVRDNMSWSKLTTGAYCWYNNDALTYKADFGALYNWYALNDSRKIAPTGWHVATKDEWNTLTTYLGGTSAASGKMKESGISNWMTPNTGTNSSGFTALPGGFLITLFTGVEGCALWWSATESSNLGSSWSLEIFNNLEIGMGYQSNHNGFSVRCVKD